MPWEWRVLPLSQIVDITTARKSSTAMKLALAQLFQNRHLKC